MVHSVNGGGYPRVVEDQYGASSSDLLVQENTRRLEACENNLQRLKTCFLEMTDTLQTDEQNILSILNGKQSMKETLLELQNKYPNNIRIKNCLEIIANLEKFIEEEAQKSDCNKIIYMFLNPN